METYREAGHRVGKADSGQSCMFLHSVMAASWSALRTLWDAVPVLSLEGRRYADILPGPAGAESGQTSDVRRLINQSRRLTFTAGCRDPGCGQTRLSHASLASP
ncbi:hypothetical protein AAFF_G00352270 [Aldrovandia affinis]|uniref:Uncharacterized protein n=1 Tax=Aldrovandia affinis TaxID=143900 RepID=A0AAD7WNR7_9TELE|nr:hypothetical protein AAFF_G00352270 [Aldrovandia affinis]